MKKKKIIITGISGFIGSNLARHLIKKGNYDIIGIDKVNRDIPKEVKFYLLNINDELPSFKDVYAVIHLAAKAGVRESQEKFDQYVFDNIYGTKNILDICSKIWRPNIILMASSSSIYGDNQGKPSKEEDPYQPKSLYALSKIAMEQMTESYLNNGILKSQLCNLRLFTVYGPNQRKGLAIRNFIDNILRYENITVYGDGTQTRDFTYIDDLCTIFERLINAECIPRYLNAGLGNSVSLNKVINIISRESQIPVTINSFRIIIVVTKPRCPKIVPSRRY